ncbi:von Willebrand factor type A domain-containing protein [Lachnospiraceae bacterium XBB1006]|nr:von Willebrand factor type A domain-containing protein [Lachnospiraceae bacterium XBB1006]
MSKKRICKVVALFMAVVLAATSVQVGEFRAKAENGGKTEQKGPLLSKKAVKCEDNLTPGQTDYDITLAIGGDGTTTEQEAEPIDLVFVLDASNSMVKNMWGNSASTWNETRWYVMQNNINAMLENISNLSSESRVSVIAYAGGYNYGSDYKTLVDGLTVDQYTSFQSEYTFERENGFRALQKTVDGRTYDEDGGGTNCKAGFIGALENLNTLAESEAGKKRNRYVVYMSDGKPTFSSQYRGEYNSGQYNAAYSYKDGIIENKNVVTGNDVLSKKVRTEAYNVANRINGMNGVSIFTVGIGKDMNTTGKYLLDPTGDFNYGQTYYEAKTDDAMANTFDDILAKIVEDTRIKAKKVDDKLSDYVDIYTDRDMVLHINGENGSENITLRYTATEGNKVTFVDANNSENIVTYDLGTRTLSWNIDKELGFGEGISLTYRVHTNEEVDVNETFDGDWAVKGDKDTGTYAEQKGYISNDNAELTYTSEAQTGEQTAEFPKPVVRNEAPCTLIVTKQLSEGSFDPDGNYAFSVELEKNALDVGSIKASVEPTNYNATTENNKWKCTFTLKKNESVTLEGIPSGSKFKVDESKDNTVSSYYEHQISWNVSVNGKAEETKNKESVSGVVKAESKGDGVQKVSYYTITDDSTKYDSETNLPITYEVKRPRKISETEGLFRKINGVWTEGPTEAELADAQRTLYHYTDGMWYVEKPYEKTLQPNRRVNVQYSDGTPDTVSANELTAVDVSDYYEYEGKLLRRVTTGESWWFDKPDEYTFYDLESGQVVLICKRTHVINTWTPELPNKASGTWYTIRKDGKTRYVKETGQEISYHDVELLGDDGYYSATDTKTKLATWATNHQYSNKEITGPDNNKVITFKAWNQRYDSVKDYCIDTLKYEKKTKTTYEGIVGDVTWDALTDVTCINNFTPKKTSLTINKNLATEDNLDDNVFIFKIENMDKNSPGYRSVVYKEIAFAKGDQSKQVTIDDLYLAFETGYKITEVSHMRYEADKEEKTIALEDTQGGAVTFTNTKVKESEFSGSACVVNHGELQDGIIHFSNNNKTSLVRMRILAFGVTKVISTCAKMLARAIR